MSTSRTISVCAWAAIIAAWAHGGTVQESSHSSTVIASVAPWPKGREAASQTIETHAANNPGDPWQGAELVDHLGEPLEPADYWALAQPGMVGLWPPPEFARPYQGPVLLLRGQGQESMQRICGKHPGMILLGCAEKPSGNGVPRVALADRATILQNGWTENLNGIHEAGHLNGSWGHDGWRNLAQLGAPAAASPRPVETPAKPMPEGRPKAIVVAQADVPPEDQYIDEPPPPPRRRPPPYYGPAPYAPPPPPPWAYPPGPWPWHPCPVIGPLTGWRVCI
jgi:hypothetical protein